MSPESPLDGVKRATISQEDQMIGVFPIIRKYTGIRIRTSHDRDYAVSVIAEADPHINFVFEEGPIIFKIAKNQEDLLINAIRTASIRWINLVPPEVDISELLKRKARNDKDWQK